MSFLTKAQQKIESDLRNKLHENIKEHVIALVPIIKEYTTNSPNTKRGLGENTMRESAIAIITNEIRKEFNNEHTTQTPK